MNRVIDVVAQAPRIDAPCATEAHVVFHRAPIDSSDHHPQK
jgi:hypothetical protein